MKFKLFISTILFIFFSAANAFGEISIKAEVDKTSISTDETLTYKLAITSTENEAAQPQIPKFTGFNVISQAQSSTFSYLKTGPRTVLVFAFILAPNDIGKFKIEPSVIKLKSKTYSTDSFEIEVTQGKAKPQVPPEEKPSLPEEFQPESGQPKITL
jgi:hypothetical protein